MCVKQLYLFNGSIHLKKNKKLKYMKGLKYVFLGHSEGMKAYRIVCSDTIKIMKIEMLCS